jgi:hypothetical protein
LQIHIYNFWLRIAIGLPSLLSILFLNSVPLNKILAKNRLYFFGETPTVRHLAKNRATVLERSLGLGRAVTEVKPF